MDSSGNIDIDSDYVNLHKKLPTSSSNTPELAGHTHKLQQIHEFATVKLKYLSQPTEIFNHTNEVEPTDLANINTTPSKQY